jgi:hypothetical protein
MLDPRLGVQWRTVTGRRSGFVNRMKYDRVVKLADAMMENTPDFAAAVETKTDFVIGEGFTLAAEDPALFDYLKKWWGPEINNLDMELEDKVSSLTKYGRQFYPAFLGDDGFVRLGVFDVREVIDIERDPFDRSVAIAVKVQDGVGDGTWYPVIHKSKRDGKWKYGNVKNPATGEWEWDLERETERPVAGVFCLLVNSPQGTQDGRPDFLSGFDVFDSLMDLLFTTLERARIQNRLVGQWKINATGKDFDDRKEEIELAGPPRSGSLVVLNEAESFDWKTPSVGSSEVAQLNQEMVRLEAAATRLGTLWMGDLGNTETNRTVQSKPVVRMLSKRQAQWVAFLRMMIDFSIMWAQEQGMFQGYDVDRLSYELKADPVEDKDRAAEVALVTAILDMVDRAIEAKVLTLDEVRTIARAEFRAMGYELGDDDEAAAEIDAQTAEEQAFKDRLAQRAAERFQGQVPSRAQGEQVAPAEGDAGKVAA